MLSYSPGLNVITRFFYRRVKEGSESGREDVMTEAEVRLGKKKRQSSWL